MMFQLFLTLAGGVALTILTKLSVERFDKRTMQVGTTAVFVVYILGNLFFTVFSRDMGSGAYLELKPFQSYVRMFETVQTGFTNVTGFYALLFQGISSWSGILLNVLLYYPMGYLLSVRFPRLKFRQVILIGFLCSIATEVAQYTLQIGWWETDDVMHNTIGTALGAWMWRLQVKRWK